MLVDVRCKTFAPLCQRLHLFNVSFARYIMCVLIYRTVCKFDGNGLRAGVITADTCIAAQIFISLHNVNNLRIPFCRTLVCAKPRAGLYKDTIPFAIFAHRNGRFSCRMNTTSLRYFFHIGYNGSQYSGWQRFPDIVSVQQVLETALARILKTPVSIFGCGRTDASVHASQFFFHADLNTTWDFDLLFRLNKTLPADIAIFDIIPVDADAHARFDATSRAYDYFIHTYKDPFLNGISTLYPERYLDLGRMQAALSLLLNYTDYRAFCKAPDKNRTTLCHITTARLYASPNGDRLRIHISANRFLSKMIRLITGKLLLIGKGHMSVDQFEHYLVNTEPPERFSLALPQGLFLSKVTYPFLDIPCRPEFSAVVNTNGNWQAVQA